VTIHVETMTAAELLRRLSEVPGETPVVISVPAGEDAFALFSVTDLMDVSHDGSPPVMTVVGRDPRVLEHGTFEARPFGFILPED
jgi:hypothetical protein